tara:strand:- start:199 stop:1260 length:1062 start_codon:yes stop_codon:yes gene_type:complete
MDGILLNKKIGIIGGGITGLIVGIFLAKEGHKVSILEKNTLLSQTSSKTTKLLHGGLRYLENFHFNEVKNGLNDRSWWLENFPKHTRELKILIPFENIFSLALIKSLLGIKLYEFLAGSKNLGKSSISKQIKNDHFILKENYKTYLSFFDGSMDDESLGKELISIAKELNIEILEFNEVKNFDTKGAVDKNHFDKIILAVGPWSKILLEQNNILSQKEIDYIKGSHLIINRRLESGLMFSGICKSRYIFALPYKNNTLLGTTEEKVFHPEFPKISEDETKYLIDSFNQIISKPIAKNEIVSSYSGVRPLIKSRDNFHKSSRDFFIQENDSLLTIFGGKWTTSPSIARKIVTMI